MLQNVQKIRFGIPGSYQTEPNNTEPKLRYSVNSVRFGRTLVHSETPSSTQNQNKKQRLCGINYFLAKKVIKTPKHCSILAKNVINKIHF